MLSFNIFENDSVAFAFFEMSTNPGKVGSFEQIKAFLAAAKYQVAETVLDNLLQPRLSFMY